VKKLPPKKLLAANLRKLRTDIGLSQEELAERAGLHRTYVSSIERGERNVSVVNICLLADALGIEPSELLKQPHAHGHS
jgi:transcriptional regulator with XRE-family HTH domain